ncbi:MAG: glycoside hydrolase family 3 C-terminal domain-containing protein, partial [Ruminiclostridium sp.]
GERHSFNAVASKKDMYETYLPAFKKLVKDAKVEAVMGAYNRTNGEPCCGSKTLLKDILRDEWGFKGHITSDCWAIKDFHEHHMVTKTAPESVALAVNNGCDVNCGNMYLNLLIAYNEGLIDEAKIDESVSRLMMTRMKLGMFDSDENVPYTSIPYDIVDCKEHTALSLEAAKDSIVLLKNENNFLPLNRNKLTSIAVIGPNADSRDALTGNYFGTASQYITVLEGIRQCVPASVRINYSEGCHLYKDKVGGLAMPNNRISEAISAAENSEVVIMCLGLDASIEGEEGDAGNEYASGDKLDLKLPGLQQQLLETIHATGKPIILMLLSGSALAVTWADDNIPAIVQAWYPGAQGGSAIASMLFGEYSPSGRLPVTFYKTTEELPDFYNYSMSNRTYRYMENQALYPFGYGLSYSKFEYSNLNISSNKITSGENISCSITVKNIGSRESKEVVQLYLKDVDTSVTAPKWQLRGIQKISLLPKEQTVVNFIVTPEDMMLVNAAGESVLEPGSFEIYMGGSQPDSRSISLTGCEVLKNSFELV